MLREKVRGLPEKEKQGALVVLGQLNEDVKDSERRQVFDDYLAYREAVEAGRFKDAPKEEFGPGLQGFLLKRGEAAGDRKRYFGKESAVRRELTAEEERAKAAEEAKRKAASKGITTADNAGSEKAPPLKAGEGKSSNFGVFSKQDKQMTAEKSEKDIEMQHLSQQRNPVKEDGSAEAQEEIEKHEKEYREALENMLGIMATGSLSGVRAITIGGKNFGADDVVEAACMVKEFKDVYDRERGKNKSREEAVKIAFENVAVEKIRGAVLNSFLGKMGLNKVQSSTLGGALSNVLPERKGGNKDTGTGASLGDYSDAIKLES